MIEKIIFITLCMLCNLCNQQEGFFVGNKKEHLIVSSLNDNSDAQVDEYQNILRE